LRQEPWSSSSKFGNLLNEAAAMLVRRLKILRKTAGQTMTEYALILAAVAVVAYGLTPTSGFNFLDDAITGLITKVTSML
jgi:Flp pilus assembly pilin Flp